MKSDESQVVVFSASGGKRVRNSFDGVKRRSVKQRYLRNAFYL